MLEFLNSLVNSLIPDAFEYEEGYFGGAEGALRFLVLMVIIVISIIVWSLIKV